jgi:osmotically-inducible protein OsmY
MVFKPQTFHGQTPEIDKPAGFGGVEAKVADALARAGDLDATEVGVTETDGEIVLDGVVLYPEEAEIAGDIASRVAGPTRVRNLIRWRSDTSRGG